MLVILNSLNAHNLPNFQLILIILVSKFMVHRARPDKTYSSLGLLSPLKLCLFSYPLVSAYVLETQKNCLKETVLLSTNSICFEK